MTAKFALLRKLPGIRPRTPRQTLLFSTLLLLPLAVGCGVQSAQQELKFEPNLVHSTKYEILEEMPMGQAGEDAFWIVNDLFGTPENPKLPPQLTENDDFAEFISLDNLHRASGAADAEGRGLYARHCTKCHGTTGNGRGEIAAIQSPYPRDYRPGIFKFKSTPRGIKPTKADLHRLIQHGIGGTAMEPLEKMALNETITTADIEALVDYVIFLSIRGELERTVIDDGVMEGIIADGDRILDVERFLKLRQDPELIDTMQAKLDAAEEAGDKTLVDELKEQVDALEITRDSWGFVEDYLADIADSWLESEDEILDVPEPPSNLPIAESQVDVAKLLASDQADAFKASVQRGHELFLGKIAACATCHGKEGAGDGQRGDYDDWTKDWTTKIRIKPDNREALVPLLARGAMEPKNILPRNFSEGIFRGGKSSKELYRRITQGIDGTPMPALTFVDGEVERDDVWHLINFIRSRETPTDPIPTADSVKPMDSVTVTIPAAGEEQASLSQSPFAMVASHSGASH